MRRRTLHTLENGPFGIRNSAYRVLNTSDAWHIRRRNRVQLSEKQREKSVFDKSECEVSLVDLRSGVEEADGGGRASSSIGVSAKELCDICFNSLYRLRSINLRQVAKSASLMEISEP